jgi:peptidyl-prolyl cis-trans isomerase SurA
MNDSMTGLCRILIAALLLTLAPCAARAAGAADQRSGVESIAVVVNSDVITASELAARMKLILISSGLPNTPEVRNKIKPQILNSLIEEHLMMQEAKRQKVAVGKDEIQRGFETVAKQNNLTADQFRAMLARASIPASTLTDQIEAQIAWGQVIQKKIRPEVTIGDADVDDALQRMKTNIGKQQYLVADIFLAVTAPQDEPKIRALADHLTQEMVKNHIPFSRVASQFSQAAGASRGGDLGWVQEGQLPPELDHVLAQMKEGELGKPVRTEGGYHILFLRKKMTVTEASIPSRDGMLEKLGMDELDRRQRRYLMDLKTAAFIEHRA